MSRLLLISNSTLHGGGYLDHAAEEIRNFARRSVPTVFISYALYDRRMYSEQARNRLNQRAQEAGYRIAIGA